jgi:AraC-like DNA-binding protein
MTDTLSDVLRAVRLQGAVFFQVEASTPWVSEAADQEKIASHIGPGVEHVIPYHVVTEGSCWGGIIGEPAIQLQAGDILVFPQGDPHALSSSPGLRGKKARLPDHPTEHRLPLLVSLNGGGAERTHLICGFLGCDAQPFNPLLGALPRVIHLRVSEYDGRIVRPFVEIALAESMQMTSGAECVLARLSELLFIEVVRRHVAKLPPENVGWLAGLRDEYIGRALQRLHAHPAHRWSLEDLAKECGVSRSVLAERFTRVVGSPPMQYLADWRMQLAASLLRSSSASLAEIAERVGYGSETALSHAFKRRLGIAPAPYRRGEPIAARN